MSSGANPSFDKEGVPYHLPDDPSGGDAVATARKRLTYRQRVGAAFISFIYFYEHVHTGHAVKASSLDKAARAAQADIAVSLALALQRAMLALIGTHRRRTYAHDLYYGLHKLYELFAKPWNAACEGSEHKHQEIKSFYADMVCHSDKRDGHSDAYEILRLQLVKDRLKMDFGDKILPHSKYAASRLDRQWEVAGKGKRKERTIGTKMVVHSEEDSAKMAVARALKAAEALQGSPNRRGHGA